jgi:hypothetical protein
VTRSQIERRLTHLQTRLPVGCPACRSLPPFIILREGEPEPPTTCGVCGCPVSGLHVIRIVRVERGPQ